MLKDNNVKYRYQRYQLFIGKKDVDQNTDKLNVLHYTPDLFVTQFVSIKVDVK